MLTVENLEVVYNDVVLVLRGLSLEVGDGQIVALLGANGAGKTTTMRAVSGLLEVHEGDITKGSIHFQGTDITHKDPSERVKMGISQVMEGRRIFAELTVDENLTAGAYTNLDAKSVKAQHDRVMTLFPRIADRRKSVAGYMSGGEQQMLAIARILRTGANLLLLDEITEGLAPVILKSLDQVIRKLREKGFTIILVEQNFRFAAPLADRHYVIEHGQVVEQIDAADLEAKKEQLNRHLSV